MSYTNYETLAKRIFELDPYHFLDTEEKPGCIISELVEELKSEDGKIDAIKFLLNYIDNNI